MSADQIQPNNTLAVGTILLSGRDLETETKGQWVLCDGRSYLISEKPKLFEAIGNLYGLDYSYLGVQHTHNFDVNSSNMNWKYPFPINACYCLSNGDQWVATDVPSNGTLWYVPTNAVATNLGQVGGNYTFLHNGKLYCIKHTTGSSAKYDHWYLYIFNGASRLAEIEITSYFSHNRSEDIRFHFIYNGYLYLVTYSYGYPVKLFRIGDDNSILKEEITGLTDGAVGILFNYANNKLYFSTGHTYDMTTKTLKNETVPDFVAALTNQTNPSSYSWYNNSRIYRALNKVYDLNSFKQIFTCINTNSNGNHFFLFEHNNIWYQLGNFAEGTSNVQWHGRIVEYPRNHDGLFYTLPPLNLILQVPSDVRNKYYTENNSKDNIGVPNSISYSSPSDFQVLPLGSTGYHSTGSSVYEIDYGIFGFRVIKDRVRIPYQLEQSENILNAYIKVS